MGNSADSKLAISTAGGWVATASFDVTADSYAALRRDYGEPI